MHFFTLGLELYEFELQKGFYNIQKQAFPMQLHQQAKPTNSVKLL